MNIKDEAALPHMGGVRVKPLEWRERVEGFTCSENGVLSYTIMNSRNRVYGIRGDHDGAAEFASAEEAKAAAQADYERRIMSAIELSAPPRVVADEVVNAAKRIRDTAMEQTMAARIPESGHFGAIAQDADWLVDHITACQQEVERLRAKVKELDGECQQSILDICRERERAETVEARNAELIRALEESRQVLAKLLSAGYNNPSATPEEIDAAFWSVDAALSQATGEQANERD